MPPTTVSSESILRLSRFTQEVLLERAILALDDPSGELDAVAPLTRTQALATIARLTKNRAVGPSRLRPTAHKLDVALGLPTGTNAGRIPCPAHGEHRKRTLAWRRDGDRLLLHCFRGCLFDQICAAVGVSS